MPFTATGRRPEAFRQMPGPLGPCPTCQSRPGEFSKRRSAIRLHAMVFPWDLLENTNDSATQLASKGTTPPTRHVTTSQHSRRSAKGSLSALCHLLGQGLHLVSERALSNVYQMGEWRIAACTGLASEQGRVGERTGKYRETRLTRLPIALQGWETKHLGGNQHTVKRIDGKRG